MFQSDREGPNRLFVVDVATRAVKRVGTAGDWHDEEPQWSPDGARIAFSSTRGGRGNYDIFVMQADGSGVTRLTDDPAADQDPAWAADGRSLFFTSERNGRGEIYRVWIDTRKVDRLTSGLSRAIICRRKRDLPCLFPNLWCCNPCGRKRQSPPTMQYPFQPSRSKLPRLSGLARERRQQWPEALQ